MPIVWPASLPQTPLIGWSEDLGNGTIRTPTDHGPAQVRRRYTATVRNFSMPLALTESQMNTLDTFWETTTAQGSLRFEWQHPRTGATHEFRFLEQPKPTEAAHGLYRLSLPMELMP